jgi:hypothetical protein
MTHCRYVGIDRDRELSHFEGGVRIALSASNFVSLPTKTKGFLLRSEFYRSCNESGVNVRHGRAPLHDTVSCLSIEAERVFCQRDHVERRQLYTAGLPCGEDTVV